jgi:hypothetical protein
MKADILREPVDDPAAWRVQALGSSSSGTESRHNASPREDLATSYPRILLPSASNHTDVDLLLNFSIVHTRQHVREKF